MARQSRPHLIRKSNGIYYFRMRIPADIRNWFPKLEISKSLHTRDWRTAVSSVTVHEQEARQLFERLRSGMYTTKEMESLAKRYMDHWLAENEANRFGIGAEVYRWAQQQALERGIFEQELKKKQKVLASYDPEKLAAAADCIIRELGLPAMDPEDPAYLQLGHLKLQSDLSICEVEEKRAKGDYNNEYDRARRLHGAGSAAPPETAPDDNRRISVLQAQYEDEHTAGKRWTEKTLSQHWATLNFLREALGDVDVAGVTHQDLLRARDLMRKLPANRDKLAKYRGKTVNELAALEVANPMSITTVNNNFARVRTFFTWFLKHEHIERNPALNLNIPTGRDMRNERKAFSQADLTRLITALSTEVLKPAARPERRWIPLIALYSGMRLNEICQLHKRDVREVDGILCFCLTDDDQKIKTDAGRRIVPVHQKLLDLGFRAYWKSIRGKNKQLWPKLTKKRDGYSRNFDNWWRPFLREHITQDSQKVFHSLRHTFTTQMHNAGVDRATISQLVGHAEGGQTLGRYSKGLKPETLKAALAKLDYGLELKGLSQ